MPVLALLWPSSPRANRPFDSTDAAVADKGEMKIELGPLGLIREPGEGALIAPSLVLGWGIADGWEISVEGRQLIRLGGEESGPRLRVEGVGVFLKTMLREGSLQRRAGISVATELGALLPALNGETGAGLEWTLALSQRWDPLTLHLNGAVAWTRAHVLGLFGGVALEGPDAWTVCPVAELLVESARDVATAVSGLGGVIWRAGEGLSFDAALRLARAGNIDIVELRAGLTWGFSVGWPR